jgi:hypothetical protein
MAFARKFESFDSDARCHTTAVIALTQHGATQHHEWAVLDPAAKALLQDLGHQPQARAATSRVTSLNTSDAPERSSVAASSCDTTQQACSRHN